MTGENSGSFHTMSRTPAFVAFALAALLALLVEPMCAAYHSPGHTQPSGVQVSADVLGNGAEHGHTERCCASVHEAMPAAPAAAVAAAFKSHAAAVAAAASFAPAWRFTVFSVAPRVQPGAPPPYRSYYARSARILS